jgi:hypothetical protein
MPATRFSVSSRRRSPYNRPLSDARGTVSKARNGGRMDFSFSIFRLKFVIGGETLLPNVV